MATQLTSLDFIRYEMLFLLHWKFEGFPAGKEIDCSEYNSSYRSTACFEFNKQNKQPVESRRGTENSTLAECVRFFAFTHSQRVIR